jgi:hypothetical protein
MRKIIIGCLLTLVLCSSVAAHPIPASTWDKLAECETGGNWQYRGQWEEAGGDGVWVYQGGLGFYVETWDNPAFRPFAWDRWGFPDDAYEATRAQQIKVAHRIVHRVGWKAWPACSARLGLR